MLIAKLKEPLEKIYQGPGISTITATCEYIAVSAENYEMNSSSTHFYYKIGKIEFDNENNPIKFEAIIRGYIDLTAEELIDWGTDDYFAIKAVANKLGVELNEEIKINSPNIIFKS